MLSNTSNTFLINTLHEIGAIQFGEFKLKSGQTSPIYINLRKIISYPQLLKQVGDAMWTFMQEWSFDFICGVPYTALPIATGIALKHHIPMVMRRKEKKDYGTKQMIEGVFSPNQSCVIIEDVVTTGSSILETAHDLEQAGLKIAGIVALIDREQGGEITLSTQYNYKSVINLTTILNTLVNDECLNEDEHHIVTQLMAARSRS